MKHQHSRQRAPDDDDLERSDVIDRLLRTLSEEEFKPNDTATFMKRERDLSGETEWRQRQIDSYGGLGRRVELIEQLARKNHEDILFKVGVASLKRWQAEQSRKLDKWLTWICVGIAAIAAVYGTIILVVFEHVYK